MGKVSDITGLRFGRLLVVKFVGLNKWNKSIWACKCDCGSEVDATSANLKNGNVRSCGCFQREFSSKRHLIDLTGKRFGRLIVLSKSSRMGNRNEVMWDCICDCGNRTTILGRSIREYRTISCGCYHSDVVAKQHTTHGRSKTAEYRYALVNKRRENKIIFDSKWTDEMEKSLRDFFKKCVICNKDSQLSTDHVHPLTKGNGLIPGNAIRLCKTCNSRKSQYNPENLPKTFPEGSGEKILLAAQQFKEHWESTHPTVTGNS